MDELIKETLDLLNAIEHSTQEDTSANRQCDELTLLHIRKAKEWQGMKRPFKPPREEDAIPVWDLLQLDRLR